MDKTAKGRWGRLASAFNINYLNPFFVFFELYYRAYSMLAAAFDQSHVLQADHIAAELYGSDALTDALMKVNVDAPLLQAKVHRLVKELLPEAPDLSNMYAAWDELCNEALTSKERTAIQSKQQAQEKSYTHLAVSTRERDQMWEKSLARTGSHWRRQPTLGERLAALTPLPKASQPNTAPALELFDNLETIEEQVTENTTERIKEEIEREMAAPRIIPEPGEEKQPKWLDRIFGDPASMRILIGLLLFTALPGIVSGCIGLIACKNLRARRNAFLILVVSLGWALTLFAIFVLLRR
jgi:hypothetical protein